jgi:hypothetical protein
VASGLLQKRLSDAFWQASGLITTWKRSKKRSPAASPVFIE